MTATSEDRACAVERCLAGETLRAVAADYGVTHQCVSLWVIAVGGSMDAVRDAEKARERAAKAVERARFESVRNAHKREVVAAETRAKAEILRVADLYDVSPYTIGQWLELSGPYGTKLGVKRLRSDARLPARASDEGLELAAHIAAVCFPITKLRWLSYKLMKERQAA